MSPTSGDHATRDQIWQEFLKSPESAPPKGGNVDWYYTSQGIDVAQQYRFEAQLRLFPGQTAGELENQALSDAEQVKQGATARIALGFITLGIGMLFATAAMFGNFVLFLPALPCIYAGMTWARAGTDKRRRFQYDQKFAADVKRYAGQVGT